MTRWPHSGDFERVYALADQWLADTRPPRSPSVLVDLIERVPPMAGSIAADLGSFDGKWAEQIAARFGCRVIPLDIAHRPIQHPLRRGLTRVRADMQALPFRSSSLSLAWCGDVLWLASVPLLVIDEIARILAPGGGAVVCTTLPTERLEPRERQEFFSALDTPFWWSLGRAPIDAAIDRSPLEVVHEERFSPEIQESALAEADRDLLKDLVVLARLERERQAFEAMAPGPWAARLRALSSWAVYLLLGKLETRAWVLRMPSNKRLADADRVESGRDPARLRQRASDQAPWILVASPHREASSPSRDS